MLEELEYGTIILKPSITYYKNKDISTSWDYIVFCHD